jgi:hypothetical protein
MKPPVIEESVLRRLVQALKDGVSTRDLENRFGLSTATIKRIRVEHGIPLPIRLWPTDLERKRATQLAPPSVDFLDTNKRRRGGRALLNRRYKERHHPNIIDD